MSLLFETEAERHERWRKQDQLERELSREHQRYTNSDEAAGVIRWENGWQWVNGPTLRSLLAEHTREHWRDCPLCDDTCDWCDDTVIGLVSTTCNCGHPIRVHPGDIDTIRGRFTCPWHGDDY